MTTEQVAAYVGAAAWLPQIISWAYQAYVTPQIEVIAGRTASIGYTRFGPIFNLNLAFSAQRKSAVIELLEAIVTHEDGERHVFQMDGMSESMSDITDASGNKTAISKEQTTLAFKIGTEVLLEKFVRFQEQRFHDSLDPLVQIGGDIVKFERGKGGDYFARLLDRKEYHDILGFHNDYFWWKPGRYDVSFHMKSPSRIKVKHSVFSFRLTQIDIDGLRMNMMQFPAEYQNVVRGGEEGYQLQKVVWQWRAPRFERKNA